MSEHLRKKAVDAPQAKKGYRTFKSLESLNSTNIQTIQNIIQDHYYPPQCSTNKYHLKSKACNSLEGRKRMQCNF